uniref:hypothetical protein n=1 Tax=Candidatus Scatocola faecipullorum TaxID=2840917 RepID=UPI0040278E77
MYHFFDFVCPFQGRFRQTGRRGVGYQPSESDKVLISESCTHHAIEDDIGRVKIPNWLKKKTGADLQISHVSGCDFPGDLREYKLVVQCGGCMNNRSEILSRINKCETLNVPITNYGVCISELKGVLSRILEPFGLNKR